MFAAHGLHERSMLDRAWIEGPKGRREFGVIRSVESCARVVEFGGKGVTKLGWTARPPHEP
jgi:hypothetical protein